MHKSDLCSISICCLLQEPPARAARRASAEFAAAACPFALGPPLRQGWQDTFSSHA